MPHGSLLCAVSDCGEDLWEAVTHDQTASEVIAERLTTVVRGGPSLGGLDVGVKAAYGKHRHLRNLAGSPTGINWVTLCAGTAPRSTA